MISSSFIHFIRLLRIAALITVNVCNNILLDKVFRSHQLFLSK
ncbi:hypothetical protein JOJ88_005039 [Pantoea cypripedii]|nr:hypothetical protein [Pantoea cypripedii]